MAFVSFRTQNCVALHIISAPSLQTLRRSARQFWLREAAYDVVKLVSYLFLLVK